MACGHPRVSAAVEHQAVNESAKVDTKNNVPVRYWVLELGRVDLFRLSFGQMKYNPQVVARRTTTSNVTKGQESS